MSTFSITKYTSAYQMQWDELVSQIPNASFLFQRAFMEYHQDRFTDHSLLIFKAEKLVALLPANIKDNAVISHGGLSYGGLLLMPKIGLKDYVGIYRQLLIFLKEEGVSALQIKCIPLIYNTVIDQKEALVLSWLEADLQRKDTYSYIGMENYSGPNRNRNRAIKNAVSHGLKVKATDDLETFWNAILIPNLKARFGVDPVHSLEEIRMLKEKFPANIKLFGAFDGAVMKAGALLFVETNIAHFQYSSGLEDRAEDGALDLLFSEVIHHFNDKQYVSFGTSNEGQGGKVNAGLLYWKDSFNGNLAVQEFYSIPTMNYTKLENRFS